MKQVDLEPHEFRPQGKPRMLSRKQVIQVALLSAVALIAGTYAMFNVDAWWAMFAPWPAVFALGAAMGFLVPEVLFHDEDR